MGRRKLNVMDEGDTSQLEDVDNSVEEKEEKMSEENLVIVNTTKHGVRLPPKSADEVGKMMMPGENDLSDSEWSEALKSPAIKMWKSQGLIVSNGPGVARPLLDTLDSFGANDGKDRIKKEKQIRQLRRWAKGTKNEYLKKACLAEISKREG